MPGRAPLVRDYMTRLPVEVEQCQTVAEALVLMQTEHVRHVPVMSGSRLQGVVSHRDLLDARIHFGDDAGQVSLERICQRDVLTVSPVTPVDEVARQMVARKVGSAVVVDGGFVVGIFTDTDGLRALSAIFARQST